MSSLFLSVIAPVMTEEHKQKCCCQDRSQLAVDVRAMEDYCRNVGLPATISQCIKCNLNLQRIWKVVRVYFVVEFAEFKQQWDAFQV
jgi:hypothetical protein